MDSNIHQGNAGKEQMQDGATPGNLMGGSPALLLEMSSGSSCKSSDFILFDLLCDFGKIWVIPPGWYICLCNKDTLSHTKLAPTWWNDPRMCTHNKDNEWYIYLRNKDTMLQSLPQPGGMTQECALIIRIMNGTSTYVTRTPCHKALPQPGGMTQECALSC